MRGLVAVSASYRHWKSFSLGLSRPLHATGSKRPSLDDEEIDRER